jgi:mannan endo-1,4-beta-mannosidase
MTPPAIGMGCRRSSTIGFSPRYWASSKSTKPYLLLNIGNEVGDDQVDAAQFISGYTSAVQALRGAGIMVPLVVDASTWGQNLDILDSTAAALIEADEQKNLLFSVHLYWSQSCGTSADVIRTRLERSVGLGYPLLVGEFSKYGGFPCNDPAASICSAAGEIDYQTILQVCNEHEIGWYAWEWGPGNGFNDPLCEVMDMTPDRLFRSLKAGWAEEVAISSPFSIRNTSITAPALTDAQGIPDGERNHERTGRNAQRPRQRCSAGGGYRS